MKPARRAAAVDFGKLEFAAIGFIDDNSTDVTTDVITDVLLPVES